MATQKNYVVAVIKSDGVLRYVMLSKSVASGILKCTLGAAERFYKKDTAAVVRTAKLYFDHVAVFHIDTAEVDAAEWAKSIAAVAPHANAVEAAVMLGTQSTQQFTDGIVQQVPELEPVHEYVVAMKTFDPRDGTHDIRFLTHADYHCQTDKQLAEAKRWFKLEIARARAQKFSLEYVAGTNEAAREHSVLYGIPRIWAVSDIGSESWKEWAIAPYTIIRDSNSCNIDPLKDYTGKPHPLARVPAKYNSGTEEASRQLEEVPNVRDFFGGVFYWVVVLLILAALGLALWSMEKYEGVQMTKYCQSAWGDVSEQVGYNPNAGTNGQCTMLVNGKMVPVTTALALYPSVRMYASQTVEGERGVTVPAKASGSTAVPNGVGKQETKL